MTSTTWIKPLLYMIANKKGIWITGLIIGASLSEPHTSVTALHTCVCVCLLACFDRSLTVNFKESLYILYKESVAYSQCGL